jgi:predicted transcriptional regulator
MSRQDTPTAKQDRGVTDDGTDVRDRLEREADRAIDGFDEGIVDLLSWVLDTETRARIYVYLRQHPESTSEEVADGTGLYPSTVREALAELHGEAKVTREKRENSGAGNNPYEYSAMAPSDLVGEVVEDVQAELNTVFNLDRYLGDAHRDEEQLPSTDANTDSPVTITVHDETSDRTGGVGNDGGDTDTADANSPNSEAAGAGRSPQSSLAEETGDSDGSDQ